MLEILIRNGAYKDKVDLRRCPSRRKENFYALFKA